MASTPDSPGGPPADEILTQQLRARGVDQAAIERLLKTPAPGAAPRPHGVPSAASHLPEPPVFEPVELDLPTDGQTTPQSRSEAENKFRAAILCRTRGDYAGAIEACRSGLMLAHGDPIGLEMLGDLYQGIADVPRALSAYRLASSVPGARGSAEKKFAALLALQAGAGVEVAPAPRLPVVALLTLCAPGLGHLYIGRTTAGITYLSLLALAAASFRFGPVLDTASRTAHSMSGPFKVIGVATVVLWIWALVDACISVTGHKSGAPTGWEV